MDDLSRFRAISKGRTNEAAANPQHSAINRKVASLGARANSCVQPHLLTQCTPQLLDDISSHTPRIKHPMEAVSSIIRTAFTFAVSYILALA